MTPVAEPRLEWAIRSSLLDYVRTNGTLSCTPQQLWDGAGFRFPVVRTEPLDDGLIGECVGEVLMRAHAGAMNVLIRDPHVVLRAGAGLVTVDAAPWGRIALAELQPDDDGGGGASDRRLFRAVLAKEAGALFGGFYPPGSPLDAAVVVGLSALLDSTKGTDT